MKPAGTSSVLKSEMEPCDQVRAAVADGTLHRHTELGAHVSGCDVCRELVEALPSLELSTQGSAEHDVPVVDAEALFAVLTTRLERERGPAAFLRSRPTVVRRVALGGILVLLFAALFAVDPKRAFDPAELLHRQLGLVALLSFIVAAAWLTLAPLHRPLLGQTTKRVLMGGSLGLALLVGLAPTTGWWTDASAAWPRSVGLGCFVFGLVVAAPTYFLVRSFDRSAFGPSLVTGALVAGLAGNLALHLRCFHRETQHFLIGHFGVVLLALLLATLWGRRTPIPSGLDPEAS